MIIGGIILVVLVVLIVKRLQEKEQETFEKRDH